MTIREMQKVLNDYMADVSNECGGEINILIGKRLYSIRSVSGFNIIPELTIEVGELVYSDET